MATLREYFIKDGATNLTTQETWEMKNNETGQRLGEVTARLHYDFDAHAKYISFYIPAMDGVEFPEAIALNSVGDVLKWPERLAVSTRIGGKEKKGQDLVFTGQVYLYSERPASEGSMNRLIEESRAFGWYLTFRSATYMEERNKWEKPRAFVSHDSRDKKEIAEPLTLQLGKLMCPVWFDQYSLKIGDSLRESIETGLKECPKCILILTPHFLNNNGWTKREYDSIFTRELVEKKRVILPVWHGVTAEDIYKYSPVLADRVGVQWSEGVEEVARRLYQAIDAGDDLIDHSSA